jgi:transcriptional regulator with XRE-family HTH domain
VDRALVRRNKDRLDRTIGGNIRFERETRRISREELAEILDLTVSHMGLIERGERGATAVNLEKLSGIFGVTIDSLFSERDSGYREVRESDDPTEATEAARKKVNSLLTRLDTGELDIVVGLVKGLLARKTKISA